MPGKERQLCSECGGFSVQKAEDGVSLKSEDPACFGKGRMLNYPCSVVSRVINQTDKSKGQILCQFPGCMRLTLVKNIQSKGGNVLISFCKRLSQRDQHLLFFTVHPLLVSVIE